MASANPDQNGDVLPPEQPSLLPASELAAAVFSEKLERTTGEYTASRLRDRRPEDYRTVVALLARGYGSQRVADFFRNQGKTLSKNTVKAVRVAEGDTIDTLRERLAVQCLEGAESDLETARIIVDEILADPKRRKKLTIRDAQSLLVSAGIAIEKGQLLSGLPTSRVAVDEIRQPDHDDFNRYLAGLKSIDPATKVIDLPPTDSAGGTAGQKEGATTATPARPGQIGAPGDAPDARSTAPVDVPSVAPDAKTPTKEP